MAKQENLPFDRGDFDTQGAFDTLLGKEYEIEDVNWTASGGAKPLRSGKLITVRLVKNASTVALLPKRVVSYSTATDKYGIDINGYVSVTGQDWGGVTDEFLPASGVPVGGVFYIVVAGPSKVVTPDASATFQGNISVGNLLLAATAAASTGATAGRVVALTSATDPAQFINSLGRALSAATTGQTATDILCEINHF